MSQLRAVRTGLKAMFHQPALVLCETVWRWLFASCSLILAFYAVALYLRSLPVSNADLFGLSGILPPLFWPSVRHIFSGSAPTAFAAVVATFFGITALWWAASSAGCCAILGTLAGHARIWRAVAGLQALRVLLRMMLLLGIAAAAAVAAFCSRVNQEIDHNLFLLAFLPPVLVLYVIFSWLTWYLELAQVVAAARRAGSGEVISSAAAISRAASAQFIWVSLVYAIARIFLFGYAFFAMLGLLNTVAGSPRGAWMALLLLCAGLYAVAHSIIEVWRIGAWMRIVQWQKEEESVTSTSQVFIYPAPMHQDMAAPITSGPAAS